MNQNDRSLLGITESNAWGNLFSYSLLAAQSLDFSASAAGRIDTEAARQLRMAQGMIRTRIDILVKEAFYVSKTVNGKEVRLKVATEPLEAFSSLQVACSEDSARMQARENLYEQTRQDIGNALLRLDGEEVEIEGALISNLVEIIKAELAFYRMPLENSFNPISSDQKHLLNSLRFGAVVIADIIHQAIERLRNKLAAYQDLYVCTNCGYLFYELPDKCHICESGQSLIIQYPFQIKGDIEALEMRLYESYNQRHR